MKKTLITLTALAITFEASATAVSDTHVFTNITNGDSIVLNQGTEEEETISVSTVNGAYTGLDTQITATDSSLLGAHTANRQSAYTYTFSLDLDTMATWLKNNATGAEVWILTVKPLNADGTDSSTGDIGLKLNGDGNIEITWGSNGRGNDYKSQLFNESGSNVTLTSTYTSLAYNRSDASLGDVVLSFTVGNGNDTDATSGTRVYTEDGTQIIGETGLRSGNNYQVSAIQFNSAFIENFAITPYQLRDASDIKAVAKLVPEPATATLSLLALAGLAARRRRK